MKNLGMSEEKKKKIDNFWYYYKYHVLAGAFAIFLVIIFIRDIVNRIDYDYCVAMVGNYPVEDDDRTSLQEWFEEHGKDLNGDGEIHVQIGEYYIPQEGDPGYDPQVLAANQTKFTVDMQEGTSMLFFLSEENYETFRNMGVLPKERENYVEVSTCKGFEEAGEPESVRGMIAAMRLIDEDTKMAKKEETKVYKEESERIFKEFIGE